MACLFRALMQRAILITMMLGSAAAMADAPLPGFADPVLGRWDITVDGSDGSYPSWMEIRLRTETQLMAEFVGRFGSKRHATQVSYTEDRLEVRIPAQYERDGEELVFIGALENDRLTGYTHIDNGERSDWTGVRAPSLHRAAATKWGQPRALIQDDLTGWLPRSESSVSCWTVANGVLSAAPPCVDLISAERFEDFRLQLEFRYPEGSNSGVYLRGRYEIQIQDDRDKAIDPLRIGGVYGFLAPRVNAAGSPGDWQTMNVELVGRRVTISLNGVEVVANREIPGITGGALDSREASAGPLMLQGDHGPIEFRNVTITPAQ